MQTKRKANSLSYILGDLIESGRLDSARTQLRSLNLAEIPRDEMAVIASFARRVNLPSIGLRLLYPLVHGSKNHPPDANAKERAEYAGNLIRIGAVDEALAQLQPLDPKALPDVYLFRAFAHVGCWNYAASISPLKKYIAISSDDYQIQVARVNLAAAWTFERNYKELEPLIQKLLWSTKKHRQTLLHGSVLKLAACSAIENRQWEEGNSLLNQAAAALVTEGGLESLFVRKWRAFLEALRSQSKASLRSVYTVREQASQLKHWESVRDCDRVIALIGGEVSLVSHLVFGTPFSSFRERLKKDLGKGFSLPISYQWQLGEGETTKLIRLNDYESLDRNLAVNVLSILCSDFYRPFRVPELHFRIYPGEFFNYETSRVRVRMALSRARKWFKSKNLPLSIEEGEGGYRLATSSTGVAIELKAKGIEIQNDAVFFNRLKKAWPTENFSAKQAAELLGISSRSVNRYLSTLIESGSIKRQGKGRTVHYKVTKGVNRLLVPKVD